MLLSRAWAAKVTFATRMLPRWSISERQLQKPILVEGPAGVGKTELGKVLAGALGMELIRLQCYEGLDEAKSLYEWEYAKQLLYTQILKDKIGEVLQGTQTLQEAVECIANQDGVFFSDRFFCRDLC